MTNEEIIKYTFSSPENTNPNVLRSMLTSLSGGAASSSGDESIVQAMKVDADMETGALNKTWQELYEAQENGTILFNIDPANDVIYFLYCFQNINYYVKGVNFDCNVVLFKANSTTDYPTFTNDNNSEPTL